jgi:hypothetical protein
MVVVVAAALIAMALAKARVVTVVQGGLVKNLNVILCEV